MKRLQCRKRIAQDICNDYHIEMHVGYEYFLYFIVIMSRLNINNSKYEMVIANQTYEMKIISLNLHIFDFVSKTDELRIEKKFFCVSKTNHIVIQM